MQISPALKKAIVEVVVEADGLASPSGRGLRDLYEHLRQRYPKAHYIPPPSNMNVIRRALELLVNSGRLTVDGGTRKIYAIRPVPRSGDHLATESEVAAIRQEDEPVYAISYTDHALDDDEPEVIESEPSVIDDTEVVDPAIVAALHERIALLEGRLRQQLDPGAVADSLLQKLIAKVKEPTVPPVKLEEARHRIVGLEAEIIEARRTRDAATAELERLRQEAKESTELLEAADETIKTLEAALTEYREANEEFKEHNAELAKGLETIRRNQLILRDQVAEQIYDTLGGGSALTFIDEITEQLTNAVLPEDIQRRRAAAKKKRNGDT